MIAARHTWLLRNTGTAYESVGTDDGYGCKICAAEGHTNRVLFHEFERHLAYHRRESVVKEPPRTDFLQECE